LFIYSHLGICQSVLDSLTRSEERNYNKISYQSLRVPSSISTNVSLLADYLTQEAKTELEKVRAFYVWITSNIAYDFRSLEKNLYPVQTPEVVIARRTALCQGFADLFHELCEEVDIRSAVIYGYSKGYGYKPGKEFFVSDHAWNAVRVNNLWYLLDATWGAGSGITQKSGLEDGFNDKYFLTPPEKFVEDHLPLDPMWQLLNNLVPLQVYEKGEAEINAFMETAHKTFNFKDSLMRWESSDVYQVAIESHKRSITFNPKNKRAVYELGTELLFKALDVMDGIHGVSYGDFDNLVEEMRKSMFDLLHEAAFHFSNIPSSHPDYETASTLLEEVTFQKGVFYYEVGQRIYDIFLEMDREAFYRNLANGILQIDNYYDLATYYFKLVNDESRYFPQAREYIQNYIINKNPLRPGN